MKPGTPSAVPWPLFGALVFCALAVCAVALWDSSPVKISAVRLIPRGTYFSAECDVTNDTSNRLSRVVRFSIDVSHSNTYPFVALDQRDIPVSLGPLESKHLKCDFPNTYRQLPDRANAVIVPLAMPSNPVAVELPQDFLAHHLAITLGLGSFCLAVSLLLIARMWHFHRGDTFRKKACWTLILLISLAGWLAYGGLFRPPGNNEMPGWISSWYAE